MMDQGELSPVGKVDDEQSSTGLSGNRARVKVTQTKYSTVSRQCELNMNALAQNKRSCKKQTRCLQTLHPEAERTKRCSQKHTVAPNWCGCEVMGPNRHRGSQIVKLRSERLQKHVQPNLLRACGQLHLELPYLVLLSCE